MSLDCRALPDNLRHARPEVRAGLFACQVDINTGDQAVLETIREPIGKKRAADILRWRSLNGQFTEMQQLNHISGVSHRKVAKLIVRVRLSVRDVNGTITHYVAYSNGSKEPPHAR